MPSGRGASTPHGDAADLFAAADLLAAGDRVGRYRVERLAGVGGMGAVYRATHDATGDVVALKVFHAREAAGEVRVGPASAAWDARAVAATEHGTGSGAPSSDSRFAREASVLAAMSHDGIVRYVDHGIAPDGRAYIAMEWLEGEDLAERLTLGPLGVTQGVRLVLRVAEALAEAHRQGLVHRDVKPSNLFLVGGDLDRVKLLDFGVVRSIHEPRLTRSGAAVGTPLYMAPEQARGERSVGPRADVFALGCLLFECIAGVSPFAAPSAPEVFVRMLHEDAPRLRSVVPSVPLSLDLLVARMLARDAALRPVDARAVAIGLASLDLRAATETVDDPTAESLTGVERRLVYAVAAVPATSADGDRLLAAADAALEGSNGHADRGDDGVVQVVLDGATLADRAASVAIALRAIGGGAVAVAAGRVVAGNVRAADDARERARRLATARASSGDETAGVRLDTLAADLLGRHYDVASDAGGFSLLGARHADVGPFRVLGRDVAFMGRDRDLALLSGLLAESASESEARVGLVIGAAGIGKTRLVHELVKRASSRTEPLDVLRGRCSSLAAGSPFALLALAVRGAADIHDGDPAAEQRGKLRATVAAHVVSDHVDRVTSFLGEIAGVRFPDDASEELRAARHDAVLMGDAMRAAWEEWLDARSRERPVLLLLEDVHWGDLPSVRFVDAALRHLRERPFCVIATARPEIDEGLLALGAERDRTTLRLAPLSSKAAARVVRQAMGPDAAASDVDAIVERAGGNPLYLEELARAFARGDLDTLPDTMLGVVQARLDVLDTRAKRALRAASVFGQRFWAEGVAALLDGEPIAASLRDVAAREITSRAPTSSLPGQTEYAFAHSVLRDAAYATLTERDRQLAHRLAAEWLEAMGESDPMTLARHHELGGALADAARWYLVGTQRAIAGDDTQAALAWVQRGLACDARGELAARFRLLASDAHYLRGALADAEAEAEAACDGVEPGSEEWFRAAGAAMSAAGQRGANDRVEAWLDRVRTNDARGADATIAQAVATARGATQLVAAGRRAAAEAAIARLEALPSNDAQATAWRARARSLWALATGRPEDALLRMQEAFDAYERVHDVRGACFTRIWRASAHLFLGEVEQAADLARVAIANAERIGARYMIHWARYAQGKVLASTGDLVGAERVLGAVIDELRDSPRVVGGALVYLSIARAGAGAFEAATEAAERALSLSIAPPLRAAALAQRGRTLLARGDVAGALASTRESAAILARVGALEEFDALARLAHAEALHAAGDEAAARATIAEARDGLVARARTIADAARRDSFLSRVPEHAAIVRLAREWGLADAGS